MDQQQQPAGVQYPAYMREPSPAPCQMPPQPPPAYTPSNTGIAATGAAQLPVPAPVVPQYDSKMQNMMYQQQQPPPAPAAQNVIVVQQQPSAAPNVVKVENTPVVTDNYLTMSWILLVFTTFFLCLYVWPCAFTALALSSMARDAQRRGEEDSAKKLARGSLVCNICTVVSLLLGILAIIITGSVLGTSGSSSSGYYSYRYTYYSYYYYK